MNNNKSRHSSDDANVANNKTVLHQAIKQLQERKNTITWPKIFLGVAVGATIVGAFVSTKILDRIDKNLANAKEAARPANIKIIKITAPNCADCFAIDTALGAFKKQQVAIKEEKAVPYDSSEGKALVQKYKIKRIPSLIATGEVTKPNVKGFFLANGTILKDTFIFTKTPPVFIDPATNREMGKVTATILTNPSCDQCSNPKLTISSLQQSGVRIASQKEVAWNSQEGQQLINTYAITKVPTFILSSEAALYPVITANWQQLGTIAQDKTYVATNVRSPYYDIQKRQVIGLLRIIYITDSNCPTCYNPQKVNEPILKNFGIGFSSIQTVDAQSPQGQSLIAQYKITKEPTFLLSPQADQNTGLKNVWPNVGTVEQNGWYVFRDMTKIGNPTYKDLSTNQIVNPPQLAPTGGPKK